MSVILRALGGKIPGNPTPKPIDIPLKEKALTIEQYIFQVHKKLMEDKASCERVILQLNGKYYQESSSVLKHSWEKVRQTVEKALEVDVDGHECSAHGREFIPTVKSNLEGAISLEKYNAKRAASPLAIPTETVEAVDSVNGYLRFEKQRDEFVQLLHDIIQIQKAGKGDFYQEKLNLQVRLKQLNGEYYGDPASLLDQAWKVSLEMPALGVNFRRLEQERIAILKRLEGIEKLLHAPVKEAVHLYNVTIELYQRKEQLLARRHELCGSYYGDPSSLLDRAWREDRDQHKILDAERRAVDARLEEVEQQLRLPAHPTMSYLTLAQELLGKKQVEIDNASTKPVARQLVDPFAYPTWKT